jgi:protein ImuB
MASSRHTPLWASLYLPSLLLDTMTTDGDCPPAIAIVERCHNRQQVRSCNDTARHAGIRPGMPLNSAYSILPSLSAVEYDAEHEAQLLYQTGEWAMQYSSLVSLHPPCHVLIEIGASRHLFGDFGTLIATLQQGLADIGYQASIGIAPTALAANVLARAGVRVGTASLQRLPSLLGELPVQYLEFDETVIEGLLRSGIRDIASLLEVPAASLTRRFGPDCPQTLARLLGQHPDPRTPIRLSDFFKRSLELPLEIDNTGALQFTTQRLVGELAAFLIARDCGVNGFELSLRHHRQPDTRLQLRFLQATSQARHLHRVLSERLAQIELPEPVIGLSLSATTFSQIERDAGDLFAKSRSQQKTLGEITDKLCSRLGADAVYTLATVDDHRPERAWQKQFPGGDTGLQPADAWPDRPLWLLPAPQPATRALTLLPGAERIESGWWEDDDVRRDYYIAHDKQGSRYWVFRNRDNTDTLYIHGLFA